MGEDTGTTPAPGVGFRALAEAPRGWRKPERPRREFTRLCKANTPRVFGVGAKDCARGGRAPPESERRDPPGLPSAALSENT